MGNRKLQKYQPADQCVLVCTTLCVYQMLDWTCNHPRQEYFRNSVDGLEKLRSTTQSAPANCEMTIRAKISCIQADLAEIDSLPTSRL